MRKTESVIEHYSSTNVQIHDTLVKEFMVTSKERTTKSIYAKDGTKIGSEDTTIDILTKLAGSIGFIQQCQAALQKNIYSENDIKAINRRLDRIPPELLQSISDPTVLEPIET